MLVHRTPLRPCPIILCALFLACSGSDKNQGSAGTSGHAAGSGGFSVAGNGGAGDGATAGTGATAGGDGQTAGTGAGGAGGDGGGAPVEAPAHPTCASELPVVQEADPARAERGRAFLQSTPLAMGVLPEQIVRNLWVAWGGFPPANDAAYWAAFRQRYGMLEAPFDNGGKPLGVRSEGGTVSFDCMVCHGGRIAGVTLLGGANHMIDLETFYDDLLKMRDLAPMYGFPQPPVPYDLDGFTYAAGAQDAFGLGFRFAGSIVSGLQSDFGPQKPPAWWLLQHKERAFWDGSASASGHRTMAATLVAWGATPQQLAARDEDFIDIAHYIRSRQPPCWTFTTLDTDTVTRGQAIFEATCAGCHGVHEGESASFPNEVSSLAEVGTDPLRATRFGTAEATALNASWFGEPPFTPTGGYLAQPLAGVWARAPYFHNGSVPDLISVLDSTQRPVRWRRHGTELEHYDLERVGLRYDAVDQAPDPSTREGRLVYDTTREGMSNAGHLYGDTLSDPERSDLLEYLRSL